MNFYFTGDVTFNVTVDSKASIADVEKIKQELLKQLLQEKRSDRPLKCK